MNDSTAILREYAQAIRGDWGSIDGRSVRLNLNSIADWIDFVEPFPGRLRARLDLGICPAGFGHWDYHCSDSCQRCTASITLRDEEHRYVGCLLPSNHVGAHTDGSGTSWTDGDNHD